MQGKRFIFILFACFWLVGQAVPRVTEAINLLLPQTPVKDLLLDTTGKRGLVKFNHKQHEGLLTRADGLAHKAPANLACVGCHHTVTNILDRKQFQSCRDCHREQGYADNPVPAARNVKDEAGRDLELNSMEINHRLCITCHREEKPRPEWQGRKIPITCSECHDRNALPAQAIAYDLTPPPADDAPVGDGLAKAIPTELVSTPKDDPLGYAGKSRVEQPDDKPDVNAILKPDRWRIGFPEDPRAQEGRLINPYNQNVFKGDYPIIGQHTFLNVTLESESFTNVRRIPLPSNVSSERPNSSEFFGRGRQIFAKQSFITSFELFHGDTSFKPIDWRIKFTPVFNLNYLNTQERSIVNVNPVIGSNRFDTYIGIQEAFYEYRIGDTNSLWSSVKRGLRGKGREENTSPYFDSTFVRLGIQQFNSDFRGLIFNDYNLGARVFGQAKNNRYNFNAAYFYQLEKDTNSELNTRLFIPGSGHNRFRNQSVVIANLYRQDTKYKGYTTQFSFHFNNDRPSQLFDRNNFPARPALIGDYVRHGIKSYYFGVTGDGHIGLMNLNHAFYQVIGRDSFNQIAGRKTDINAQLAAVELSQDRDWLRFKTSFFFTSGDSKPFDGKARGFDSIFDDQEFAGGKNSFFNSQAIPFLNTGVLLTTPGTLIPSLRSSKTQGQSNFVNPGIFVYNAGFEAELTPKVRGIFNANYMHFHHTAPLSQLLFQPNIRRPIGFDYGVGFLWRPPLTENFIITGGFNSLVPGTGFKDIFRSNCAGQGCGAKPQVLYSIYVKVKLTY